MTQGSLDFAGTPDDSGLDEVDPTYTVSQLVEAVNAVLRHGFGDGVWVRGEIQGWSERGPHAYFRLVEHTDDVRASIEVAWFAPQRTRLRPLMAKSGIVPADGMKVRIYGRFDVYPQSGRLSLKMAGIDPRHTLGEMSLQRDAVIRRLVAGGLYDANRRVAVPVAPLRVGVVTSVGSAAWHDFVDELRRSGFGFAVTVVDTRVQGEQAVERVSAAIRGLGRRTDIDIVAVVRGGGARTELATFDAEPIAMAIATSARPVWTGLGHEVDRSVADEVANRALKTPTAVAAALVERVRELRDATEAGWAAVGEAARRHLDRDAARLADRAQRIRVRTVGAIERASARLDAHAAAVARRPAQVLAAEERHLDAVEARVRALDPSATLARGWSITRRPDGRVVRDATELAVGEPLTTTFERGSATSRVEEVSP
jgi:exodeoxyribonuclease VII large subunit